MADYDFTTCLSPLDFELLSKDLLEVELGIQLENFSEGRDKGIDLRYAPVRRSGNPVFQNQVFNLALLGSRPKPPELIVQCKRYSSFSNLKSELKNKELPKIIKLKPDRYILTTSVSLSPPQVDELKSILSPFVQSTGDIYGFERLNSLLSKYPEIERRHIKLWVTSAGVLDSILNAGTHMVSREEVERTIAAAKIYVRNTSFDEALAILKKQRSYPPYLNQSFLSAVSQMVEGRVFYQPNDPGYATWFDTVWQTMVDVQNGTRTPKQGVEDVISQ